MWKLAVVLYFVTTVHSKEIQNLKEISSFIKNSSHIKDEPELLRKINKVIVDGRDRLLIISDFDNTLTADNGIREKPVLNSFEMFRKCPSLPQSYKDEDYKLYLTNMQIENNPNMSIAEKSHSMLEWYKTAFILMKGIKFPRQELMAMARDAVDGFRDGIRPLVSWTQTNEVPVLVISSGLGEAVVDTLEAANLTSTNVKVISNFLQLDTADIIIGLKGDPIHSLNKNEVNHKEAEYYNEIKDRHNIILMGDALGDANMAEGIDARNTVIKIGYLSTKRLNQMSEYLNYFDIVLENDQTMDVINDLVSLSKAHHTRSYGHNLMIFAIVCVLSCFR